MQNDNYVPKVGEKCLFDTGRYHDNNKWQEVIVIGKTSKGAVAFEYNEDGMVGAIADELIETQCRYFKPLPTEEDKLTLSLWRTINFNDDSSDDSIIRLERFKDYVKAIKAGYRKVDPISFKDYAKLVSDNSFSQELMFKALADNKHIIVKDGE